MAAKCCILKEKKVEGESKDNLPILSYTSRGMCRSLGSAIIFLGLLLGHHLGMFSLFYEENMYMHFHNV